MKWQTKFKIIFESDIEGVSSTPSASRIGTSCNDGAAPSAVVTDGPGR
jgi:hypothetical protein